MSRLSVLLGLDALCAAIDRHAAAVIEAAKIEAKWIVPPLPEAPPPAPPREPHQAAFDEWLASKRYFERQHEHYRALFLIAIGLMQPTADWPVAAARRELASAGAPLP